MPRPIGRQFPDCQSPRTCRFESRPIDVTVEGGNDHINNTPKLVASRALDKVEWRNSSILRGNVADALNKLKQLPGRNISMIGSATLVRALLQDDVLDELRLLVHPIVVGRGKKLFEGDVQKKLKLVESKTFQTGVLNLIYQRA